MCSGDFFNQEIIGDSACVNKVSNLVIKAFAKVKINLKQIEIVHTEVGNEFKNKQINKT